MEHIEVNSSNVKSYAFDQSKQILEIEFHNGSRYQYESVPQSLVSEMVQSDSIGKYFSSNIRNDYSGSKV